MPNQLSDGIVALRPFLPAKDFEISMRFYADLGFEISLLGDKLAHVGFGNFTFLLQDYFVKEWAENFMMHLMVDELDVWWDHIVSLDLAVKFGVPPPQPPALQSWGLRVAYVIDPSGVLWHVAQRRKGAAQD